MVVVIVRHFVKPGMVDVAQQRIDANGERMALTLGFMFRHVLHAASDAHDIVTLTGWESAAHYEQWCSLQRSAAPPAAQVAEAPYVRVETELFEVRRSHVTARVSQ